MNQLAVTGRLGKDPELKYTHAGDAVCNFSIAVERKSSNKGKTDPLWLTVACFGKLGEACPQHLKKGRQVAVSGALEVRNYETKDGAKRTSVAVIAYAVDFLGDSLASQARSSEKSRSSADNSRESRPFQASDSDIPF
jgi:single-strand DNA-binding protein